MQVRVQQAATGQAVGLSWNCQESEALQQPRTWISSCSLQLFGFVGPWVQMQKKDLKRYGCLIRLWLYQWLSPWLEINGHVIQPQRDFSLISKPSTFRTISMSRRTSVLMETHLSSWKHTLLLQEKLQFTKLPLSFNVFWIIHSIHICYLYIPISTFIHGIFQLCHACYVPTYLYIFHLQS